MLFLLGFMGLALDFGHLFVAKDELQTSVDACALAAAQELNGATDALTRASSAGLTAGNLNRVDFQSGTWSGQGKMINSEITFRDATYAVTTVAANAQYAQCNHQQNGVRMWLIQAMGASVGSSHAAYAGTNSVGALAVARRAGTQKTCPVPLGLIPKSVGSSPNYGFQVGEWVTVMGQRTPGAGQMGWNNLDGSNSASEAALELAEPGYCGVKVGDTVGKAGAKQSVADVWNARFGIYKNGDPGPSVNHPDTTGYAYTPTNWKNSVPQNAYAGQALNTCHSTADNFKTKQLLYASYDDTGTSVSGGDGITGLSMSGGYKTLATPALAGEHQQLGHSRRIVTVPVINTSSKVLDFACMLILQPMTSPTVDIQMEFIGNATSANSPCSTNGASAGGSGASVPVLVQ
jgi:hypothetical protein